MKTWLLKLATVITAFFLALVLAETTLRVLGLFEPPRLKPARPDLYQPDEHIGYRLWRSTRTCDRYPPDSPNVFAIVSNSDGFRNKREFGPAGPGPVVLVVGDSFVFGRGVAATKRFTNVLETLEPGWRVDNMGMPGWGVDLMIRSIERFVGRVQPHIVVLAVYTDDFRRLTPYYSGIGYPYQKYELTNGELTTVPYPLPTRLERMRIFQSVYQSYWRSIRFRDRYDLNAKLLDRFIELSNENEFRPVVMFLPGRRDSEPDQTRRAFLENWATRKSVPFLDLTDAIHSAGVENTYIARNYHWNSKGHEIAARNLHALLKKAFPDLSGRVRSDGPMQIVSASCKSSITQDHVSCKAKIVSCAPL